ncbi:TetR/AcrR family transcriptional regulator [Micromonospora sp. WMMA1949]|uniref:TetR/AcrR family transcriptional regulator n=1 Tax=unclassified Micromonospora TaxID=2617518 RepID=UPI0022B629EE|nr:MULTISPECIES: TetR/AcrR family transcriptional regulator [unclassified Micromonospora]MCZ7426727.1 TetR/AcrR family transcriptional regulator [Micromonospora sp. WMMA1949]WBC11246.1 TetR/AcrR family transcriptional regulator [Micromonospora sp. WMMA1947]
MSGSQSTALGRPREFDIDEALERAMQVFWARGYDGTSLTDLTSAMGITKSSMYAAFGNKEQLFRKAVQRYAEGPASYVTRALREPTARAVAETFLRGAVRTTTSPGRPAGCLSVQGALALSEQSRPAHDVLVTWRVDAGDQLEARFRRAVEEGDLPRHADPGRLARYVMTTGFGIAVQAANGLGPDTLDEIVDTALLAWPT